MIIWYYMYSTLQWMALNWEDVFPLDPLFWVPPVDAVRENPDKGNRSCPHHFALVRDRKRDIWNGVKGGRNLKGEQRGETLLVLFHFLSRSWRAIPSRVNSPSFSYLTTQWMWVSVLGLIVRSHVSVTENLHGRIWAFNVHRLHPDRYCWDALFSD